MQVRISTVNNCKNVFHDICFQTVEGMHGSEIEG